MTASGVSSGVRGNRPRQPRPRRRRLALAATIVLAALGHPVAGADRPGTPPSGPELEATVTIRLTIEGRAVLATLDDTPTARDFLTLLPMTLILTDYNRTEKVSDLARRLSTEGAPDGYDPAVGDIAYYAPWGNLALFYRDFGYAAGLVRLGRIDAGAEILAGPGPLSVTIDRAE